MYVEAGAGSLSCLLVGRVAFTEDLQFSNTTSQQLAAPRHDTPRHVTV